MGRFIRTADDSAGDALPDASAAGLVLRLYGHGDVVFIV